MLQLFSVAVTGPGMEAQIFWVLEFEIAIVALDDEALILTCAVAVFQVIPEGQITPELICALVAS